MRPTVERSPIGRVVSNERGAVLALVALLLIVFLGLAALAIDLGLLYVARGEAQRAADAAAHAGAGHLMLAHGDEEGARDAAVRTALRNTIRGESVEIRRDEDIDVLLNGQQKVRVRVHRTDEWGGTVGTLFARALGFSTVNVAAVAAAEVWAAGQAECVLPFALPDRFCTEGTGSSCTQYDGGDVAFDREEGHSYDPWILNPTDPPEKWEFNTDYTGWSKDDRGTVVTLRPEVGPPGGPPGGSGPAGGGGSFGMVPWWSLFTPSPGPVGVPPEAQVVDCVGAPTLGIGDDVQVSPGGKNPVLGFLQTIYAKDPYAEWNQAANDGRGCVTDRGSSECRGSPRIRPIVLFDPEHGPSGPAGSDNFKIANFIGIFIEEVVDTGPATQRRATVRIIEFSATKPAGLGPSEGALSQVLRIVE